MDNKPLLSILIPTKNREEYALKVVQHILGINDNRFQLIIQDNSDTNSLKDLLSPFLNDPRLKYFYYSQILSFVDTFSLGISKCTGEYITIIGDDDGINPIILNIVDWAYINCIEAITPSLQLVYFWPNSGVRSVNTNGRLIISDISCEVKFCDPKKEVNKLLKNGCQNYLSYKLAKVYHGIIKKTVLDEIKDRTGHYIGGLSPDIYLSIAASLLVEKVMIIDYPLTISGICNKSGSSDSSTGKHTGELSQAPHFKGHQNYKWSNKVPSFYSVETIWADSALAAVMELKANKIIDYFKLDILSAYCLKSYPQFKYEILKNLAKNYNISEHSILMYFHRFFAFSIVLLRILSKRIYSKLFNRKHSKIFENIPDIEKASEIVQSNLGNNDNLIMERLQAEVLHLNRQLDKQ